MSEGRKEPLIRFIGFTEDWEQRKLGAIAEQTYGGGTPRTSVDEFWNGDIPWIQSSDLTDGKVFGVVPNKMISASGLKNSATKLVPENSIAIITRVGVGKLAFMPFAYATSQDFLSLSKLNIDPWFGVYSCYKKLQSELHTVQGTSIKGITKDELLEKDISVPCMDEQKQIGQFFKILDNLITLHQRKYDLLEQTKKTLLKKLFPRDGENVPEIRFVGFEGDWKEKKLGSCFIERSERSETGELISVTINSGIVKACELDRIDNSSPDKSNYKVVKEGDIAYNSMRMWQGASGYCPYNGILSPAYTVVVPKNQIHSKFFSYNFKRQEMIWKFRINSQGLTSDTWNLKFPAFSNIKVKVPSYEEQLQISNFLSSLDMCITHHQKKLTTLKTTKQTLLNQMFI